MVLKNAGAGELIEEKDLSGKSLCSKVDELIKDKEALLKMGRKAAEISKTDANNLIYDEVMKLYKK